MKKERLVSQLILSSILGLAPLVADSSESQGIYSYFPGLPIAPGKGFTPRDPLKDHQMCFRGLKEIPINNGANDGTQVSMNVVRSAKSLRRVLGIDEKIDASYLVFKGNGEFQYNTTSEVNADEIHVVLQGRSEYSGSTLDFSEASYLPEIQKMLQEGQHREVLKVCGPELVNTIQRGSSVAVIITVKGLSRSDAEKMDLKVGASGGFGPLSASGSVALNTMMSSSSSSARLSFRAVIKGGTGLNSVATLVASMISAPKDLSELKGGIVRVLENLTPEKGAITGFSTIPLPGVNPDFQNLVSDFKVEKLGDITKVYRSHHAKYERLRQIYLDRDHLGLYPREFNGIPETVIDEGRREIPALELYVKTLAATHRKCLQDPTDLLESCKLPEQPALRMLNLIDLIARDSY